MGRGRGARLFCEVSPVLASSVFATLVHLAVDVATWRNLRAFLPLLASASLAVVNGAALGAAGVVLVGLPLRSLGRRAGRVFAAVVAALLTALAIGQALPALRPIAAGPSLLAGAGLTGLATTAVFAAAIGVVARPGRVPARTWWRVSTALLLLVFGVSLSILDRRYFALAIDKAYSFVEGLAHLALTLGSAILLRQWRSWLRPAYQDGFVTGAAGLGLAVVAVFTSAEPLRRTIEHELPVSWEEPTYTARWVRRVRWIEKHGRSVAIDRRVTASARLVPRPEVPATIAQELAPEEAPFNVVVFFVDALRADVARDPRVMPGTTRWERSATSFSRAYASGSSTLLTLVPMLGCRYDATPADPPLLLEEARGAGMKTAVVIPKTAHDYHRAAFPRLRFDEEEVVPDFEAGNRLPTARTVVERSLDWLRRERPARFFLWLYQFDVHGWSDLDARYVEHHDRATGMSKAHPPHWRYRAAAHGVDLAFDQLRDGLTELGLAEQTIVVFVSDHGEALGEKNYWAHSTYLWQSLLRVPFAIRVPGMEGRDDDAPVSTIDLGSTLLPLLGRERATADCQGRNLLREDAEERSSPILFAAMIDGAVTRIGMLAGKDRKVVADLRDGEARLFQIRDDTPLERDVSVGERAALETHLAELMRSPLQHGRAPDTTPARVAPPTQPD